MFEAMVMNFTSAPILYFVLGVIAVLVKSDLRIPGDVSRAIVIFLMASIGINAGADIAKIPGGMLALTRYAMMALVFGVAVASLSYLLLIKLLKLDFSNACALAASFAAVSSVTLMVSISMVEGLGLYYEKFIPALYPFMDSPAIITALFLAKRSMSKNNAPVVNGSPIGNDKKTWGQLIAESFTNSGVFVLIGSLLIGLIAGPARLVAEMAFFDALFRGVLCLFLLDSGIVAASRLKELRIVNPLIIPFAIVMSVISGVASVFAASFMGMSPGGVTIFAALAAGASYVTVPAAMRASMPDANPSLYIGTALGIVFPWNVLIGLPIYLHLAKALADILG
jgi:hypothetical protein